MIAVGAPSRWRRRTARRLAGDEGTSLMELMVGMLIMVIFMGMFTSAVILMTRSANKAESVTQSTAQLNKAFLTLDRTVRYAAAISKPGVGTSGDWYVELRLTNTGVETCTQLRTDITSGQVQRRTWNVVASVASAITGWSPITSGISNAGAVAGSLDQPFVLKPESDAVNFQQLGVNLVGPSGSGTTTTTSQSRFSFTAVNSVVPSPTAPICQEVSRP